MVFREVYDKQQPIGHTKLYTLCKWLGSSAVLCVFGFVIWHEISKVLVTLKVHYSNFVTIEADLLDPPNALRRRSLQTTTNYMFDLANDPTETTSVYTTNAALAASLTSKATDWMSQYNAPDVPDATGANTAYRAAGGVVPWITSTTTARTITQKYSYSAAPHIVFMLVDDWGWNDIGYQSSWLSWTTPNIDKLAQNGIKLTNHYSHELCGPSRAALLTGRYASRFGFHGDTVNIIELPLAEVTIAEEMKSAGYRTSLIGKWHMGFSTWSKTPTYRGFDYFYGFYAGAIDYWTKYNGPNFDFHENEAVVTDAFEVASTTHSAYLYQQKAEAVIADHAANYAGRPMFMYYASQLIHDAWQAPQHFIDRCYDTTSTSDQQSYCAMNLMLDEVVGNLTCALDRNGMLDNTLFVMVSDNGGLPGMIGNTYPFKGAKGSQYKGGLASAGFVHGSTNLIPAARRGASFTGLMHITDWLPTLMSAATNGAWSGSYLGTQLDGVDLFSSLQGSASGNKRREILHYLDPSGLIAYQYDDHKVVLNVDKKGSFNTPEHIFTDPGNGPDAKCEYMNTFIPSAGLPSRRPTTVPSVVPTIRPSISPTSSVPTLVPSYTPSVMPSMLPSVVPSVTPSAVLTVTPSEIPSLVPSTAPSVAPSVVPSEAPSVPPSEIPSVTPTTLPSEAPSTVPSQAPSELPTIEPSLSPTTAPSIAPTASPTNNPTTFTPLILLPSFVPSVLIEDNTDILPTVDAPTSYPTVVPTVATTGEAVNSMTNSAYRNMKSNVELNFIVCIVAAFIFLVL